MTDKITDHHDGYGLAESIRIDRLDAAHRYEAIIEGVGVVAQVQFQKGPRHEPGSTPGIIDSVLVAIVLDRLRTFQRGVHACAENGHAIVKLEEALHWMQHRARDRAKRGVLGTNAR